MSMRPRPIPFQDEKSKKQFEKKKKFLLAPHPSHLTWMWRHVWRVGLKSHHIDFKVWWCNVTCVTMYYKIWHQAGVFTSYLLLILHCMACKMWWRNLSHPGTMQYNMWRHVGRHRMLLISFVICCWHHITWPISGIDIESAPKVPENYTMLQVAAKWCFTALIPGGE